MQSNTVEHCRTKWNTIGHSGTLECQVNKIVSVAWHHLRNIFLVWKYLNQNATEAITHAFIADRYTSANPILEKLHWFPIQHRINFKIILLTFKALHGLTATYISEIISIKNCQQRTWNNKRLLFMEHTLNSTFGKKAFSIADPKLWNKLPFAIRYIDNINRFKKTIKN